MKWHPDRNQNSDESRIQFQRAAEAYKILSGQADGSKRDSESRDKHQYDDSTEQGNRDANQDQGSGEQSADSVFWEAMLDYAIKLAQTGSNETEIAEYLGKLGCSGKLNGVIAEKAFNIHAHYAAGSNKQRKGEPDQTTFKEERLQTELFRALLGPQSYIWSPRGTIDYYLMNFREFAQAKSANPLTRINVNKRLLGILNFSLALFIMIAVAVSVFPGPSKYKLLSDAIMLQVPLLVLPMMLVLTLYRKLWVASQLVLCIYLATLVYYNTEMADGLNPGLLEVTILAVMFYAPFVFIALFANYLYYRKALRMIRIARGMFTDHLDQLVWIKNRAGTSSTAAFLFIVVFATVLVQLIPQHWHIAPFFGSTLPDPALVKNEAERKKIESQTSEAEKFFDIAESHFHAASPDYLKAEMAYDIAADNGSLLAAYKLGYFHFTGNGAARDPALAFDYFNRAARAPLAFQPHSLELTTRFLAESYRNLGLMYQSGIGTPRNFNRAQEMYRKAVEFGSTRAKRNLDKVYSSGDNSNPVELVFPDYR